MWFQTMNAGTRTRLINADGKHYRDLAQEIYNFCPMPYALHKIKPKGMYCTKNKRSSQLSTDEGDKYSSIQLASGSG